MSDEQLKQDLIKQMGSGNNKTALDAVEQLRKQGWLTDGSLHGVDLSGARLAGVDLSAANLSNTNLRNADLSVANLGGANLSGADIAKSNLFLGSLFVTNLEGANLSDVILSSTKFTGTILNNANLSGAICNMTIFAATDLSSVQSLENVWHQGPSTIGIDTLYRSKGNIPEVFLRGCGVPDTMITYARSLVVNPIDYYSCFISYSSADEDFAKMLYDTLQGKGIRCWFAPEQILPGQRIDAEIHRGIQYWDKVLFCASKSSLTEKWWVDFEVDKAFTKEQELQRERGLPVNVLIPLNLDNYIFSDEYKSHPKSSLYKWTDIADFVGWEHDVAKFNQTVKKVIQGLQTDGGREKPPPPKL